MPTFLTSHLIAFLLDKPCSGPTGSPRITRQAFSLLQLFARSVPSACNTLNSSPIGVLLDLYISVSKSPLQKGQPQLPTSRKSPCFTASHIVPPAICYSFHCLSYLWCYFWKRQWFYSPQYLKSLEKYLVQNGLSTHLRWVSGWMNASSLDAHEKGASCKLGL